MNRTNAMLSRTRVLYPFVGDSVGGAQISGVTLIANLNNDLFESVLIVHEEGPFTAYLKDREIGFKILPLRTYLGRGGGLFNHTLGLVVTAPKLLVYLIRNKIGIVHTQDGRMNLTWMVPAKLARVPLIWHQRSKFSQSRLSALWARFATHIISISEYTFLTLPEALKAKSSTVENPVEVTGILPDRKSARTELCSQLNIDPDQPIIGFFGNLTVQKRPDTFIKIAAEFSECSGSPPMFVLFGADRDNLKSSLLDLSRSLKLDDRLIFRSFVKDPGRWMAGCDVVVSPGVDDAFGRTVAEAMLVGTPVVAADSGGHKLIIRNGKTGFLVAPDDVTAYATAITKILIDDHMSKSMTQTALAEASSRFSTTNHVAKVTEIYNAAIAHNGG